MIEFRHTFINGASRKSEAKLRRELGKLVGYGGGEQGFASGPKEQLIKLNWKTKQAKKNKGIGNQTSSEIQSKICEISRSSTINSKIWKTKFRYIKFAGYKIISRN